jgi:hypothetical protein
LNSAIGREADLGACRTDRSPDTLGPSRLAAKIALRAVVTDHLTLYRRKPTDVRAVRYWSERSPREETGTDDA